MSSSSRFSAKNQPRKKKGTKIGRKFKGVCLAEVEGGPEYELTLLGEAWYTFAERNASVLCYHSPFLAAVMTPS